MSSTRNGNDLTEAGARLLHLLAGLVRNRARPAGRRSGPLPDTGTTGRRVVSLL